MAHYLDYSVKSYENLWELLKSSYKCYAESSLFITLKNTITYGEFYLYVCKCIKKINQIGSGFYLIKTKRTELFAIAFFSVVIAGNIACLHNNTLNQLEEAFDGIDFTATVSDPDILTWISEEIDVSDLECSPYTFSTNNCSVILLSSGTTASPKGVCLSQKNLMSSVEAGMKKIYYPQGGRYVSVLPMYHAFGLVADLLATVYSGGILCIPDHNLQLFSCLNYFKPYALHIPPIAADKLAELLLESNAPKTVTGGNLKKIMCAGAPTSIKTIDTLKQNDIQVLCAYGVTECGSCISMNREYDYKNGSAGLILDNNIVNISPEGEILVKGSGVMIEYLQDPELTKRVLCDGWFHTGDLGYIDTDGFLFITGRLRNMAVFSNGTKYIPEELEKWIESYSDVKESLASQTGNEWHIIVCITHQLYSNTDLCTDLKNKICSDTLSKTGHMVHTLIFTEEALPRTFTGKLVRTKNEP